MRGCVLTSLSSCRRSLSTLAGRAPAWWWWNCLERFVSQQHGKQMRERARESGQTKQEIKDTSFESCVFFFWFFFFLFSLLFNSALQTFSEGRHRRSGAHKPIVSVISDHVCPLRETAHSPHSQPIKNFHRLGKAPQREPSLCRTGLLH